MGWVTQASERVTVTLDVRYTSLHFVLELYQLFIPWILAQIFRLLIWFADAKVHKGVLICKRQILEPTVYVLFWWQYIKALAVKSFRQNVDGSARSLSHLRFYFVWAYGFRCISHNVLWTSYINICLLILWACFSCPQQIIKWHLNDLQEAIEAQCRRHMQVP